MTHGFFGISATIGTCQEIRSPVCVKKNFSDEDQLYGFKVNFYMLVTNSLTHGLQNYWPIGAKMKCQQQSVATMSCLKVLPQSVAKSCCWPVSGGSGR